MRPDAITAALVLAALGLWAAPARAEFRLGDGTEESKRRMAAGFVSVWPYVDQLFQDDDLVGVLLGRAPVLLGRVGVRGAVHTLVKRPRPVVWRRLPPSSSAPSARPMLRPRGPRTAWSS